jgi:hypothetical protein
MAIESWTLLEHIEEILRATPYPLSAPALVRALRARGWHAVEREHVETVLEILDLPPTIYRLGDGRWRHSAAELTQ